MQVRRSSRRATRRLAVLALMAALASAVAVVAPPVEPASADPIVCEVVGPLVGHDSATTSGSHRFDLTTGEYYQLFARGSVVVYDWSGDVALAADDVTVDSFNFVVNHGPDAKYHAGAWHTNLNGDGTYSVRMESLPLPQYVDLQPGIRFETTASDCASNHGHVSSARDHLGRAPGNGQAGDPVSTATGNFVYQPSGLGDASAWLPTYNSADEWVWADPAFGRMGYFGRSWTSVLDVSVRVLGNVYTNTAYFRDATGREAELANASVNEWSTPDWLKAGDLTRNSSTGEFELTFDSGATWVFDPLGRLLSQVSALGESAVITRDSYGRPTRLETSYSSEPGRAWSFTDADDDGIIDSVVGPFSASESSAPSGTATVDVGVDSQHRLTSFSAAHPSGTSGSTLETYTYVRDGLISAITRAKGGALSPVSVIANTYDEYGQISEQVLPTGEVDDLSYDPDVDGVVTTVDHHAGATVERVVYHHDASGSVTSIVDPYENESSFTWDHDHVASTTSRRGAEAVTSTNSDGQVVSTDLADPDDAGDQAGETARTYCAAGDRRPVDLTEADGTVTRFWWTEGTDPNDCDTGLQIPYKVTHNLGTDAEWDQVNTATDGLPTRIVEDPGGEDITTDYVWDTGKRLMLSETIYPDGPSSAGATTYFGYDPSGHRTVERDATGVETWWVRDAAERVTSKVGPVAVTRSCTSTCSFGSTPPSGPSESWTYNLDGSLASHTDAASHTTTYAEEYLSGGGRTETVTPPAHGDDAANPTTSSVRSVTVSTFDRFDRLVSVAVGDPAASGSVATTTYTYDALGRVATKSREVGGSTPDLVESYAYDADGNQTVAAFGDDPEDSDAAQSVRDYDLRGRLIDEKGPTGDTTAPASVSGSTPTAVRSHTSWVYDDANRLLATTSGEGDTALTTFRRYDDAGRLRFVITDRDGDGDVSSSPTGGPTDDDDSVVEYRYTPGGRVASVTVGPPSVSSYDWTSGDQDLKRTTTFAYDEAGRLTSTLDAADGETTQTWTARGQRLRTTAPGGAFTEYSYDPAGKVTKVLVPSPTGTGTSESTTSYDTAGRVTEKASLHQTGASSPPASTFTYWDDGLVDTATDPIGGTGHTVSYFYDARGNRTQRVSSTQTDSGASLHQVTDVWSYDLADRVVAATPAGQGETTYGYDDTTGRRTTTTSPSGRVQTTDYWNSGLVRSVTWTKPNDDFSGADTYRTCSWYDAAGHRTFGLADDLEAEDPCTQGDVTADTWTRTAKIATHTIADNANTPSGEHESYSFAWDQQDLPLSVTYTDGSQHVFTHDQLGRLVSSGIDSGIGVVPLVDYAYDNNGNRTSETVAFDEASRTWTYPTNGTSSPATYTQQITGGDLATDLTWNGDGTLASETTDDATRAYTYDDAHELTGRSDTDGPDYTYTYGPRGERLTATVDTATTDYTYDDAARITATVTGTDETDYTYDDDGRRVDRSGPGLEVTSSYDARGRDSDDTYLATGNSPLHLDYETDIDGNRSRFTVSDDTTTYSDAYYISDPTQPGGLGLQSRMAPGFWGRFNYGLEGVGVEFSAYYGTIYFSKDHLGSTLSTPSDFLSGTGYDPFGTVEGAPSPVFEWGYRTQAHYGQLLYLRNRDYDPSTGTFTSPDPVDATPGSVTETNAYDYVESDPVDRTDVLGLSPDDCNSSFGGVVGAIANWGCHHYDGLHDFLDTTAKVSSMAAATLACAATCFEATAGVAFEASEGSTIVEEGAEEATLEGGETIDPDTVDPPDQTEPGTPDGQPESPTTPDTPDGGSEPGSDTGGDSPQCANSFSADTPVVMADGTTKAISDIHPGDRVEATDPNTGRTRARTVTAVMSHDDHDLMDVKVKSVNGQTGVVHATAHHLIWDATVHAWVQATQLHQGDRLHSLDRTTPQVATTVAVPGHHPMWDLTIDTDHDFYVDDGHGAVLVHNDGPGWIELTPGRSISPPGMNVEYLYDPASGRIVISTPGANPLNHTQLAERAGMPANSAGGELNADGLTMDESSGHFGENWTDEIRAKFQQQLDEDGFSIEHKSTFC